MPHISTHFAPRSRLSQSGLIALCLAGPLNVAFVGVAFYFSLFCLTLFQRLPVVVRNCIFMAAGVHLALVGMLVSQRAWCLPCISTTLAALATAIWLLIAYPKMLLPGILLIIAGSILGSVLLSIEAKAFTAQRQHLAQVVAQEIAHGHVPPVTGQMTLVVLTRNGCSHCAQLKAGPLPDAEKVFKGMLNVEERTAPDGVPTPTLVVLGRSNYFMVGVPTDERLTAFIRLALSAKIADSVPTGITLLPSGSVPQALK
jgi:hypothetical protein